MGPLRLIKHGKKHSECEVKGDQSLPLIAETERGALNLLPSKSILRKKKREAYEITILSVHLSPCPPNNFKSISGFL
jgi:hypothetical protein